jgi:hypothetical protein
MKDLERNWIGKSEGTEFKMFISTPNSEGEKSPISKEDFSSDDSK